LTVYARADLAYVFVSEAHGGHNTGHARPVENGAPTKTWALTCEFCEDFLRHDSNWSTTIAELPETYDRRLERERDEKMGKLDRENQLAEALIALQNLGQLPAAFAQVVESITGTPANAVAGSTVCPQGHDNKAGHKFCAECGAPMHAAGPAIEPPAAQEPPQDAPANGRKVRLRDMRLEDLQAKARERGLDDAGTRMELIDRLRAVPAAA
jgi:hypothetical protein